MLNFEELDKVTARAFDFADLSGTPGELYEPIKYMMSIGGKRLRPKFCLLVYNLFREGFPEEILNPAIGLEIFHEFTLIHDDIMDKSDMRRGMPTVHKKWNGNVAILSGDVMSIMAYRFMARTYPDMLPEVLSLFSDTAAKVCEGQQYDMNYESLESVSMPDYLKMIGLKTAVLIACSAKMGAVIACAGSRISEAVYNYAYNIGMAFQIMDDYLDSFGDVSVFGKKIGKDILCNKKTWTLIKAMELSDAGTRAEISSILDMPAETRGDEKISAMIAVYKRLGVDRAALEEVEKYHNAGYGFLTESGIGKKETMQLTAFGDMLAERIR